MDNKKCSFFENAKLTDGFFECEGCGNHVCERQAKACGGVCPHCFGRLLMPN